MKANLNLRKIDGLRVELSRGSDDLNSGAITK